jgi:hypothetical protein
MIIRIKSCFSSEENANVKGSNSDYDLASCEGNFWFDFRLQDFFISRSASLKQH